MLTCYDANTAFIQYDTFIVFMKYARDNVFIPTIACHYDALGKP